MKTDKITLFLMSKKGLNVLKSLIDNNFKNQLSFIVSAQDKKVNNDYYKEIKELCNREEIEFYNKKDNYIVESKYAIAISWRWLIKLHKTSLITIHDSILPKYRGFAPLVNALINGEKKIGVTAIFSSEKYDEGNIIVQKKKKIKYPIKIQKAIEIISNLYQSIVLEIFELIKNGSPLNSTPQNNDKATYSLWRDERDYFINWNKKSSEIKRFIDAVGYPYLGAKTYLDKDIITIIEAKVVEDVKIKNRDVGKVIFINKGFPVIVCGKGLLQIIKANYEDGNSIFPLKKFRMRFQ